MRESHTKTHTFVLSVYDDDDKDEDEDEDEDEDDDDDDDYINMGDPLRVLDVLLCSVCFAPSAGTGGPDPPDRLRRWLGRRLAVPHGFPYPISSS